MVKVGNVVAELLAGEDTFGHAVDDDSERYVGSERYFGVGDYVQIEQPGVLLIVFCAKGVSIIVRGLSNGGNSPLWVSWT